MVGLNFARCTHTNLSIDDRVVDEGSEDDVRIHIHSLIHHLTKINSETRTKTGTRKRTTTRIRTRKWTKNMTTKDEWWWLLFNEVSIMVRYLSSTVDLLKGHVRPPYDVEHDTACLSDGKIQQRRGDGREGGVHGARLALAQTDAHQRCGIWLSQG